MSDIFNSFVRKVKITNYRKVNDKNNDKRQ